MISRCLLIAASLMGLTACNPNLLFDDHCPPFENRRWYADNEVILQPNIEEPGKAHRLSLTMRHIYGFQHETFRVRMNIQSPSGKAEERICDLTIKTPDGTHMAKCSVDICDLTQEVDARWTPDEAGSYRFAFRHMMLHEFVPNVMDFGMRLEKIPEE
jgi:hypothetical protein